MNLIQQVFLMGQECKNVIDLVNFKIQKNILIINSPSYIGGDFFLYIYLKIFYMRVIISESSYNLGVATYVKDLSDEIIDVKVDGNVVNVIVEGEGNFIKKEHLIKKIQNKLYELFFKKFNVIIDFEEGDFVADIKISDSGKNEFYVQVKKTMKNGEVFEVEGTLKHYHSGRSDEYEFDPEYVSDDEYYSEHWETIDELIQDKLTEYLYKKHK